MTNAMPNDHSHSDNEVLAAFLDGRLTGEELQQVLDHLGECEECRMSIADTAIFQQEQEEQQRAASSRVWWWAAAAALVAVLAFPGYQTYRHHEIQEAEDHVFAKQAEFDRPAGRLSGQTVYAKLHSPTRSAKADLPEDIDEATAVLLGTVGDDKSQIALRAKAAAQAARETTTKDAIATLETIPEKKREAATWNDLAALLQTDEGRLQDALAAADWALQKSPKMPEALFNRAMILKKMHDSRAPEAISDYFAEDPASKWADDLTRR